MKDETVSKESWDAAVSTMDCLLPDGYILMTARQLSVGQAQVCMRAFKCGPVEYQVLSDYLRRAHAEQMNRLADRIVSELMDAEE